MMGGRFSAWDAPVTIAAILNRFSIQNVLSSKLRPKQPMKVEGIACFYANELLVKTGFIVRLIVGLTLSYENGARYDR